MKNFEQDEAPIERRTTDYPPSKKVDPYPHGPPGGEKPPKDNDD